MSSRAEAFADRRASGSAFIRAPLFAQIFFGSISLLLPAVLLSLLCISRLHMLYYPGTAAFVCCFSVMSPESLKQGYEWFREVRMLYQMDVPVVLCGTHADQRKARTQLEKRDRKSLTIDQKLELGKLQQEPKTSPPPQSLTKGDPLPFVAVPIVTVAEAKKQDNPDCIPAEAMPTGLPTGASAGKVFRPEIRSSDGMVWPQQAMEFARQAGFAGYIEVCPLTAHNVVRLFDMTTRLVLADWTRRCEQNGNKHESTCACIIS